jgi:FkbM family methyltransferase
MAGFGLCKIVNLRGEQGAHEDDGGPRLVEDDLIYDVGAHLGEDTEFYLRLGYRVVAIEANPELVAKLRKRFAEALADARLTVVDCAVGESEGTIDLFVYGSADLGTARPDWAARNRRAGHSARVVPVSAMPFETLLREHGIPHYLKVDIEGSDQLCIEALGQFEERPRFISIEASVWSWRVLVRQFEVLEALGYSRFQIVPQGRHQTGTFVSRGGEPVDFTYNRHASGPFGDYLKGPWLSRRQALRRYRILWLHELLFSNRSRVGRILGRIPILGRLASVVGWYDTHAAR